jgi:hypothetical protein
MKSSPYELCDLDFLLVYLDEVGRDAFTQIRLQHPLSFVFIDTLDPSHVGDIKILCRID